MSKWHVLVEECLQLAPTGHQLSRMLPADDEQAAHRLAEEVAFTYTPVLPRRFEGRSVFRTSPTELTVAFRATAKVVPLTYTVIVKVAEWLGDRPA